VLFAWWVDRPPAPLPSTAPPEVFSAERAFVVLADIARAPHMTGSAEHTRVRERIVRALMELGFEVDVQEKTVVMPIWQLHYAVTVRNIVARKRGTASTGGVALASHYDTEPLAPGAGDDGAAIAATLEALRALALGPPLRNDLYVIVTDAEELSMIGARAFVAAHPWWPEIDLLLNFEARGAAGTSVMFETNAGNGWVVREFARADPYPVASSLFFEIYERMPQDTDFSIYKQAGITGLNFAFIERADVYHRPTDTVESLSPASLQHHGEHALALARHFGNLDLAAPRDSANVVYFRLPGLGLVSYGLDVAVYLLGVVLMASGVVIRKGIVSGVLTWIGLAAGFGASVAAAALAAAVAALLVLVIGAVHHEIGSIVGRELYDESWYGFAVACVAVAAYAAAFGFARTRVAAASLAAGALLLPLVLASVATFFAPGVSMLFVWPALFATVALDWLRARRQDDVLSGVDLMIFAVCAAVAILVFFPLVWGIYVGFSIAGAPVLAATVVLMFAFAVPLFDVAAHAHRWWLPSMAGCLAVVFTVVGIANARPGPARPVPEDLVYALDRDSGEAFWATSRANGSPWLSGFFGAATRQSDLDAFLVERPYRLAPAPLVEAARAGISIASDSTEGQPRTVRVEIRPGLVSELVTVAPTPGGASRLRAVNGIVVPEGSSADLPDWRLQHVGRPPNGALALDLEIQDNEAPIELVIVESVLRLPQLPGVERPADVTAPVEQLSDRSLFRQVVRIE
jgi:MFS family permease